MERFSTTLAQWMSNTAWTMERPAAYGSFHLTFAIAGLTLCVIFAYLLRNIGPKGNRRLLLGVGIFLTVVEIYKQVFHYYIFGNGSYQWWIFPFQLCSVPMYLCILAPLLKPGIVQKGMYNFMMIFNLLGGFMAFVEPSGICHEYWTLTLHAYIWHLLLVFVGLYLGFSGQGGKTLKDYCYAAITFVSLCVVAFCINVVFFDVSGGSINMFFIGPANSSLIVFKDIAKACGWYVSTALYIPVVCLGAFLIFLPFHLYARKRQKISV